MLKRKIKIGAIIATSLNRTELLFNRSLPSILNQTRKPDFILIVDDNKDKNIRLKNKKYLKNLKQDSILYLENKKIKGMSGTGAWNTAISWYKKNISDNDFIAILDDDDMWENTYLEKCCLKIEENEIIPDQIIAFLKRNDCSTPCEFLLEDIKITSFLIGNPGVQGSNMFFRFGAIKNINGFDENLPSCTDRDLMIRFLSQTPTPHIKIIDEVLVHHFTGPHSVTYDPEKKEKGLDEFYKKYIHLYNGYELQKTLERSEKLFKYKNSENIKKLWNLTHNFINDDKIVIGVAVHNNQKTIRATLTSILEQKNVKKQIWILIADDNSTDNWKEEVQDLLSNEKIILWKINFNNISKVRNFINNFIKNYFGKTSLIGRLDSDDVYVNDIVLSKIEAIKDKTNADVIFAGNYLKLNGEIIEKVNKADKRLANRKFLLNRLKEMSLGIAKNELPSCNTFMTLKSLRDYHNIPSAEDHFLNMELLFNKENLKLHFAEDIFVTVYSLNGDLTTNNKKEKTYIKMRKKLYEAAKNYDKQR
ncbi:glycosyltransferase family 2 protein [Treponema pedis]|uniref:glycosyltransferase family 2 protein n=3 Tax=Treponema pedis TaxID=409322 RepID=UPI003D2457BB